MMLIFHLMWVAFVFAALHNARHVLPSPSSFATWVYLGAMVDLPFLVQSLLCGSIYWCWLIFVPPLPIPIAADLLPMMKVRLLIFTCSPFAILMTVIFELSVFPSNKTFLPQHPACYKESKYNSKLRWKYYTSIGAYTRVGEVLFQMPNATCRFIKDHVESLNGQIYILSAEIASQCVSNDGFISKAYKYVGIMTAA